MKIMIGEVVSNIPLFLFKHIDRSINQRHLPGVVFIKVTRLYAHYIDEIKFQVKLVRPYQLERIFPSFLLVM